ncbi:hypothetical protein HPB48_016438 [Haemaphysalis longicornis]|uniref:Uncharacterized protein n=1 Tax=Haemaphysalis longicornis TaxID=44386 RepID=A0A9J6FD37_HAELO|nr:hypothetical protein HPB48_016438 [Haemaphysalis longicornis]
MVGIELLPAMHGAIPTTGLWPPGAGGLGSGLAGAFWPYSYGGYFNAAATAAAAAAAAAAAEAMGGGAGGRAYQAVMVPGAAATGNMEGLRRALELYHQRGVQSFFGADSALRGPAPGTFNSASIVVGSSKTEADNCNDKKP